MCCRYWTEESNELREIVEEMNRSPLIMPDRLVTEWIRPDIRPEELLPFALTDMVFEKAAG